MTVQHLHKIREELELTLDSMGELLGYNRMTIFNWENGINAIPRKVEVVLREIERKTPAECEVLLKTYFGRGYHAQYTGVREAGKLARALVEQHGLERDQAFEVAHYSRSKLRPRFTEKMKETAWLRAGKTVPVISKKELQKMLKLYAERKAK